MAVLALHEKALPLFPAPRKSFKTDRTSSEFRALVINNLQLLPKKTSNFSSSVSSPLQHRHNQDKVQNAAAGMKMLAMRRTRFDLEEAHRR